MLDPDTLPWRDSLVLTREIPIAGERTEFYERVRRGEFVSLRRGVYMATEKWLELNDDERYRARVQATVCFCHSARLPLARVCGVDLAAFPGWGRVRVRST